MKKSLFCFLLICCARSAQAAPILVTVSFSNSLNQGISSNAAFTNLPPITGGESTVYFTSTTFTNTACSGLNSALCSGATVTTGANLFDSGGAASVFAWVGGLTYTTSSAWTVNVVSGPLLWFEIDTTGVFQAPGFDPTPGNMRFSFQEPFITAGSDPSRTLYSFTASPQIPEPSSIALLGSGILGLGILARRRRS